MPLLFASCTKTDLQPDQNDNSASRTTGLRAASNTTTYYGPVVQAGNGQIRSFAVLEKQTDKPVQLGFELSAGALLNLPDGHDGDHHGASFEIKLHPKVQASGVFDHMVADWNPHGHEPGPYLLPHFDFHFYMISQAQRLAITANDPLSLSPLPAGYLPDFYIGPLGQEPQMGAHCVDVTSPELNGATFTHTFIYGAYNGKVAFYEPMVTMNFLQGAPASNSFDIRQPAHFSRSGYYPTKYSITQDASGTRYVTLSGFVYRQAD